MHSGSPSGGRHVLSPAERRRRNREEMRAAILDAARAVMREEGVAALNLQEVARRVGMRAPSLYEYFPSKAAIYDALFALGTDLYGQEIDALALGNNDFWEDFKAHFTMNLRFARENPELYHLVFERQVPGFTPSAETFAVSEQMLARSRRAFEDAIERGAIRPNVPAAQALDLVIATMQGLTAQHLANDPDAPVGAGRFGGLTESAVALFRAAWGTRQPERPGATKQSRRTTNRMNRQGRREEG